ncbi:hypothetical protein K3495_g7950 [Podosphaera aphanis]|nr:hypothetical protein K3495_g7950 [Podosphaera aphanis]
MSSTTTISVGNVKANLPILTGQANFRRWYNTWFVVLRGAEYWPVISDAQDKETRPVTGPNEKTADFLMRQKSYDTRNDAAHAALLAGLSEDLQGLVSSCAMEEESARVAMRLIKEKIDHETTTSTLELFNNFLALKMEEGEYITDHLSRFETSFQHLHSRCCESVRPEAKALKTFLSVEEVKIMCLFRSLPSSLENVIDNLSTKDNIKNADVNKRLLDLHSTKLPINNSSSSKAYFTTKDNSGKGKERQKECNWCKKLGFYYKGHVHSECRKLKAHKEQGMTEKGHRDKSETDSHQKPKTYIYIHAGELSPFGMSISGGLDY